jgi:PAS domain S-box-containing protein
MSPVRVLVVEDDLVVVRDLRARLAVLGYEAVGSTRDGGEAVRLAGELHPDLVLMDIRLGGAVDGVAAAQRIRDRFGLPVVYLTGHADEETLARAGPTEPFGYVLKPFDERDLRVVVEMAVYKHRAETRLRDSERNFRDLFQANPDPMWVFDPRTGRCLEVNGAAVSGYGYSRDEFFTMTLAGLEAPVAAPAAPGTELAPSGATATHVRRHRWKNGEIREVEVTTHCVRFGGRPVHLVIARDVTEQRRADLELRQTANLLRRAQAIAEVGGWEYSVDDGTFTGSEEANRLCGWGPGPHRLEELFRLLAPDDEPAVRAEWGAALSGVPFEVEHRLVVADRIRWVHVRGEPETDGTGRVVRIVGVTQDITERRSLEDQLRHAQKMEALGRLAGGVAHDFNNLLTIITGYVGMVLGQLPETDEFRSALVEVQRASERAADLTRQLLAFSRKQLTQPRVIDLNVLVGELAKMLGRLIGPDVDLDLVLAPDLERVKVDPGQFEQVLMNLAVNARDAMPGGGALVIETCNVQLEDAVCAGPHSARPARYVRLTVRDTGHGMDEATRRRIFEPFFTTKEAGKGTGLGLAVVDSVVRQGGGAIEVQSEVGRGTTFHIYLPRAHEAGAAPEPPPTSARASGGTETVLLVDADSAVRTVVGSILRSAGYTVLEAHDGAEALRVGRSHPGSIHLLLTDLVVPRMSGPHLAEAMTVTCPGLKVLYLSSALESPHTGGRERAVLQKPFTPDALALEVRAVLDV